jgi:glycine oxidase
MQNGYDIVIVGGGVIGMMTARELSQHGANVCVIDQADTGKAASWAGGGILSPLYPWTQNDAITHLAHWSQRAYPQLSADLQADSGIDPEYLASGLLALNVDVGEASAWASKWNIPLETVSPGDVQRLEPYLAESEQAIRLPDVAQIRNPRLLRSLRDSLDKRGVTVIENQAVNSIANDGTRVTGVVTNSGDISANHVVVACGAWTSKLLEPIGCPTIYPARGQMILLRTPPDSFRNIVLVDHHYLIPRQDGRLLVGSTLENTGFDNSTTDDAKTELKTFARTLAPILSSCPVERHWAGLRPGNDRNTPYIGAHPEMEGLYVNSGHFRNGLVLAPASARLMADLVTNQAPILPPQAYAIQ